MSDDETIEVTLSATYYAMMATLGVLTLGLFFLAAWFTSRKYPRRIGPAGIELRDGRVYPWSRVQRAVRPRYGNRAATTAIQIVFDDGTYTTTSADALTQHARIRDLLVRRQLLA